MARQADSGADNVFCAYAPAEECEVEPSFKISTFAELDEICARAALAQDTLRASTPAERAELLDAIAVSIGSDGTAIVERARLESGLSEQRLTGELARTCNQLRLFVSVLRSAHYLDVRIDEAMPERSPPRPDLRLTYVPLGPVAVFGASNFPLAFSVAGGDTASALAAGCPVIVKAHPSHPGTSVLVARAISRAIDQCGFPSGTFGMLLEPGHQLGAALVADPRICAVGFTGSRSAGLALCAIAAARDVPIPVYAEMSSINPVLVLPGALQARASAIGRNFAEAMMLGTGQFCTNPGLVVALDTAALDDFINGAVANMEQATATTMLTKGIHAAYCSATDHLTNKPHVELLGRGRNARGLDGRPALFSTTGEAFLGDSDLQKEVFGPSSLIVRVADEQQLQTLLSRIEGQLTFAIHAQGPHDVALVRKLLPLIERKAGRILFDGFGTGVEVCDAMVHGGPFPATSDIRTTSVGSLAIMRFVRPICYQQCPQELLPSILHDDNCLDIPRRINGAMPGSR